MRELSDSSAQDQARAFIGYASKGPSIYAFERWADPKDLGREDREAIREQVTAILMRGDW